ncbi:hypothetical protein ABKN59_006604 [Abortiporus biennis]
MIFDDSQPIFDTVISRTRYRIVWTSLIFQNSILDASCSSKINQTYDAVWDLKPIKFPSKKPRGSDSKPVVQHFEFLLGFSLELLFTELYLDLPISELYVFFNTPYALSCSVKGGSQGRYLIPPQALLSTSNRALLTGIHAY